VTSNWTGAQNQIESLIEELRHLVRAGALASHTAAGAIENLQQVSLELDENDEPDQGGAETGK
jgi:hypothetical protein